MMKFFLVAGLALMGATSCANQSESGMSPADQAEQTASMQAAALVAEAASNSGGGDSAAIEAYLKEMKVKKYKVSPEGLYYTVSKKGNGIMPDSGQYVKVHYTGRLLDGTVFDSSVERGEPIAFQLGTGRVIPGWDAGIPLFEVGGSGTLYIPAAMAYGERGAGNVIPPNSALVFDVEVLKTMTEEEYGTWQQEMMAKQAEAAAKAAAEQQAKDAELIAAYVAEQGLVGEMTPSGIFVAIESQGTGPKANPGSTVSVHYTGTLLDGTVFDSSVKRGEPFEFPLGQGRVIRGWDEGIALFNEGGKGTLVIPSPLCYGPRASGAIPPNSVLRFDIEVMKVK